MSMLIDDYFIVAAHHTLPFWSRISYLRNIDNTGNCSADYWQNTAIARHMVSMAL